MRPSPAKSRPRRALAAAAEFAGRSLFPLVALALILGTLWWGPWGTLLLAFLWWNVVTRIG